MLQRGSVSQEAQGRACPKKWRVMPTTGRKPWNVVHDCKLVTCLASCDCREACWRDNMNQGQSIAALLPSLTMYCIQAGAAAVYPFSPSLTCPMFVQHAGT